MQEIELLAILAVLTLGVFAVKVYMCISKILHIQLGGDYVTVKWTYERTLCNIRPGG